ncbi:MAG: YihY family inner membrane protein [Proteobacteria bacterium]|nr:YihY family inner membrane protein [Pseudomonadota bacterium]
MFADIRHRIDRYVWSYNACNPEETKSSWRHSLQIMAMAARDLYGGMLTLRSTSLVYTTLLSIIPVLAVSLVVLRGVGMHEQIEPGLLRLLAPLGEQSLVISARIVAFLKNMNYGLLGILGVSLLIYNVFSLILKVESAFNYTWRVSTSRPLLQRFSNYLMVLLVGPVLIFSAVGITASLGSNTILATLEALPYIGEVIRMTGRGLPYLLVISAFCFIYLFVPNTRVRFRSAFFGALTAGFLWESSSLLFASLIGGSTRYTAIYSSLAIMLVFMIWLYLSWLILLIGASIAYHHQHPQQLRRQQDKLPFSTRQHEQLALRVMMSIAREHDSQSEMKPTLENLASDQQVPVEVLDFVLGALEADGLIRRSSGQPLCYLPARSSNCIRLIEIFRGLRKVEDGLDDPVSRLLQEIDYGYESALGEQTLADFLTQYDKGHRGEDSLI